MRTICTLVVCLFAAGIARGQESFEAASIKPHPGVIIISSDPAVTGNRVTATASQLADIIYTAFNVRRDQVVGLPGWAASEHYDLEAAAGHAITVEQMRAMLRTLLAERFHLQVHRETREIPIYSLVLTKNGPKLKESAADETAHFSVRGNGASMLMVVAKGTMAQLASRLSGNGAGRPVIDKTGLTGIYSFRMEWVNDTAAVADLPSLPVALQEQLGLKLEPAKGPAEFIVVDHVERPSAN
jgi:uncharacterized protein (TIGR03435 family)